MNNLEKKFDFVGIGVPKSGTTYTYQLLKEHPEVAVSSHKNGVRGGFFRPNETEKRKNSILKDIEKQTSEATKVRGEFKEGYVLSKESAEKIHRHNPDMKIIASLRNPYERAYSAYRHRMSFGGYKNAEEYRARIVELGFLYRNLKPYIDIFGHENVLLLSFEELKTNPASYREKLYSFLGIDTDFTPSTEGKKVNDTSFKESFLGRFFHRKFMPTLDKLGLGGAVRSSNILRSIFFKVSTFIGKRTKKKKEFISKEEFIQSIKGIYDEDLKKLKEEYGIEL